MTTTDENGHTKDFLADAFGRTTRVREYNNTAVYTTTYGFDLLDRLTTTTDAANNVTKLTYDWLGRKTAMQDPDMGYWTYQYDNAGNLTEQHDARGNSVCFVYDDLNRATMKTARTGTSCASAPIQSSVTFGYDDTTNNNKGLGRRTSLSDSFGSNQTWKYDLQGRVLSTAQTIPGAPATYTTAFSYDAMDRVRTMTYPDGEVVTTGYNNQGLPDTLAGTNSYVSATTYNAASQLDLLTFGNGAVTDYVYNAQNLRLTDIVTTKSGNTLLNLHYTFDNVGNILSVQDNARGETTNYSYDDLNRLMSARVTTGANQYARAWQYDSIGNLTQRVENGATTTYQYNDATSKHAVTHLNGVLKYSYDANGNMTTRDGDTLAYDAENRLTQVVKGSTTTNFAYNGDGTRVKREVVGVGTTYYIGNYFEVYVPNGGSATFNKYYYFGAQRVAAKIAGTLFYFQGDHLGSSSVVMTSAGTSFYTRQTYFPYGAPRTTEGSALPTDYTFTGQKSDDSTGLMFYGARYYDSALGRFTQPDTIVPNPFNPQAFNRYAYTYNNPVRYVDPSGHVPTCDDDPACGDGDPNTGAGNQGGNQDPIEPVVDETPYCEKYPEANGCAVLPTESGGNQGPNDEGNCNIAKCGGTGPSTKTQKTPTAKAATGGGGRYYPYRPASKPDPSKDGGPTGGGPGRSVMCQLFGWFFGAFCGPNTHGAIGGIPGTRQSVVIGKLKDLRSSGSLQPGESELYLPDLGSPKTNWAQNSSRLREAMSQGVPIRDASVDSVTGALRDNTGFLRAERQLLIEHEWSYQFNATTGNGYWYPPGY